MAGKAVTPLFGPRLLDIQVGLDDRGLFVPFSAPLGDLREMRLVAPARPAGQPPPELEPPVIMPGVKRAYFVRNHARGTVRGFHLHEKEWKFFTVAVGAAKFALIGEMEWLRGELYTYGDVEVFVLSEAKPQLLVVPPGWANGWMSLTDDTVLLALSSATLEESLKDDRRFDPMRVEHVWRVKPRG